MDGPTVERGAGIVVRALRSAIRALRTDEVRPSVVERIAKTAVIVPLLGVIVIIARVRAGLRRPIDVAGSSIDGDRFPCRLPDVVQLYLWLFEIWEPDLTAYLTSELRPGDTFIDVGANIGYFSLLAAHRVQPGGRVVAIEASPSIHARLLESVEENGLESTIRAVNAAASARPGVMTIFAGPSHNLGLTTTVRSRGFAEECVVRAAPLDDLLVAEERRTARFVKIDVEGAEPEVLAGMRDLVANCRPDAEFVIELSPAWWGDKSLRPIDVLRPFFDIGMHAYEIENNYWPWRYLWRHSVRRPTRCVRDLTRRVKRIDLVLSRRDLPEL